MIYSELGFQRAGPFLPFCCSIMDQIKSVLEDPFWRHVSHLRFESHLKRMASFQPVVRMATHLFDPLMGGADPLQSRFIQCLTWSTAEGSRKSKPSILAMRRRAMRRQP